MRRTNNIEQLVNRSFLSRVPAIMAANPEIPINEAIKQAFDEDETFCYRMMLANESERHGLDRGAEEAIKLMSKQVYERLTTTCGK